jgi:hypothetical protein
MCKNAAKDGDSFAGSCIVVMIDEGISILLSNFQQFNTTHFETEIFGEPFEVLILQLYRAIFFERCLR